MSKLDSILPIFLSLFQICNINSCSPNPFAYYFFLNLVCALVLGFFSVLKATIIRSKGKLITITPPTITNYSIFQ